MGDEGGITAQDGAQIIVGGIAKIGNSNATAAGTIGSSITVTGMNANGSASSLSVGGNLYVGYDIIRGTLTIQDGAQVTCNGDVSDGGTTLNGAPNEPSGTLLVTGTNANGTASTLSGVNLSVANGAPGPSSFTVSNGAQANFQTFHASGTTFLIDNGTLRGTAPTGSSLQGSFAPGPVGTVTLGSGGATLDNSGYAFAVSAPLNGAGSLTLKGAGTFTLTGSNSYSGGTTITAGIAQFATAASLPASGTGFRPGRRDPGGERRWKQTGLQRPGVHQCHLGQRFDRRRPFERVVRLGIRFRHRYIRYRGAWTRWNVDLLG
ncbi:autotransporter-associated beta strand repeat protein [Chthoniobacter flavus Ellin428]|uniref:Autotransporter-associated beta strand repeat protein n=1 Tax=Chthoniobacter flavus Ellin428 TaxID=497964 RepID=B4CUW3_9BACT|nr:autotransporter-associated beta strand repeat-containing protein [Chthoniobacter flavus]EDY22351.1 autotransporter-associated beta strand repeat protein [Chthoniobacter flavus Ellin428]